MVWGLHHYTLGETHGVKTTDRPLGVIMKPVRVSKPELKLINDVLENFSKELPGDSKQIAEIKKRCAAVRKKLVRQAS